MCWPVAPAGILSDKLHRLHKMYVHTPLEYEFLLSAYATPFLSCSKE